MILSIAILAVIGFFISLYAYFLEKRIKADYSYKPICDISEQFSCSKPILSEYGQLIGFSNSLLGIAFYGLIFVLALMQQTTLLLYLSLASLLASAFLAYILYFKIKSVCLICTAIYLINILIFLALYFNR